MKEKTSKSAPSVPHKNTKNGTCVCKIDIDHNTAPSPHNNQERIKCRGSFEFKNPKNRNGAKHIRFIKRSCRLCGREETYSPTEIIVVFKRGISDIRAGEFILNFRIGEHAATIISDPTQNIIEKNGIIAITVSMATAAGKSVDEWITEFESQDLVLFASPRMIVAYPDSLVLSAVSPDPTQDNASEYPE